MGRDGWAWGCRTHSERRDPGPLKPCPRLCGRSTPRFPGFLTWLNPFGLDLDLTSKEFRTNQRRQGRAFNRRFWDLRDGLGRWRSYPSLSSETLCRLGCRGLLYQHTVVEYLLCAGPRLGTVVPS